MKDGYPRAGLVALAGLLAAAVLLVALRLGEETLVAVRLAVATGAVCVVPGWIVLRLAGWSHWGADVDWAERIPLAFAATLPVLTLTTVACLLAGLDIRHGAFVLLAGSGLGLLLAWRQGRDRGRAAPLGRWGWAVILCAVPLAWSLFVVGGLVGDVPNGEEGLHLLVVRKLLESRPLAVDAIFYKPRTVTTYLFPVYHFMLALIAFVSGLDPLVVYVRLRPFWAMLALLALRGVAARVAGRRLADVATLLLMAMIWSGRAGAWRGPFGRLTPYSHHADFSLGVLVPVGLLVVVHVLGADRLPRRLMLLAALMIFSILVVHTREGLQFVGYLTAAAAVGLALPRLRRAGVRAAILLALVMAAAVPYKAVHGRRVEHIAEWETAELTAAKKLAADCRLDPGPCLWGKPLWERSAYVEGWPISLHPYFILALFLVPPLLLLRSPMADLVAALVVGWLLMVRLPVAAILTVVATYSQVLFSPVRYVFHFLYVLLALALAALAGGAGRLATLLDRALAGRALVIEGEAGEAGAPAFRLELSRRTAAATPYVLPPLLAAVAAWLAFAFADRLSSLAQRHFDWVFLAVILATGAALVLRRLGASWPASSPEAAASYPSATLLALIGMVAVLLANPERPSLSLGVDGGTLFTRLAAARASPRVEALKAWYLRNRYIDMPYDMVEFVRALPAGQVLALDVTDVGRLPVLANQYVFTFGSFLSTEIDFVGTYARIEGLPIPADAPGRPRLYDLQRLYDNEVRNRFPLFNGRDTALQSLEFLRQNAVDYVIWDTSRGSRLGRGAGLPACVPEVFAVARRVGPFVAYRVNRDHIAAAAARIDPSWRCEGSAAEAAAAVTPGTSPP